MMTATDLREICDALVARRNRIDTIIELLGYLNESRPVDLRRLGKGPAVRAAR